MISFATNLTSNFSSLTFGCTETGDTYSQSAPSDLISNTRRNHVTCHNGYFVCVASRVLALLLVIHAVAHTFLKSMKMMTSTEREIIHIF